MCCKRLNLIINKIVFTILWFLAFGYLKKELVQSLIYTRHGRDRLTKAIEEHILDTFAEKQLS
jgi:hypothetical protein